MAGTSKHASANPRRRRASKIRVHGGSFRALPSPECRRHGGYCCTSYTPTTGHSQHTATIFLTLASHPKSCDPPPPTPRGIAPDLRTRRCFPHRKRRSAPGTPNDTNKQKTGVRGGRVFSNKLQVHACLGPARGFLALTRRSYSWRCTTCFLSGTPPPTHTHTARESCM